MTNRSHVDIERIDDKALLVITSDGAAMRFPSILLAGKHDGIWNSECMRFVPTDREYFSDGTPVTIYEGQGDEDA